MLQLLFNSIKKGRLPLEIDTFNYVGAVRFIISPHAIKGSNRKSKNLKGRFEKTFPTVLFHEGHLQPYAQPLPC